MINVSKVWQGQRQNGYFLATAEITFRSGETIKTDLDDIMQGGVTFDDSVSTQGSFDIGAAIINKVTIVLNNYKNKFSLYDFSGARIKLFVSLYIDDLPLETIKKGIYTVDSASSPGNTIRLECLDDMMCFDRQYDSSLTYPATLSQIVYDACANCNVALQSASFFNSAYMVQDRPLAEAITYREIIAYAAQLAGCYARLNNEGRLELKWYDMDAFTVSDRLDGGNFVDQASGDSADGGSFTDYGAGYNADGGNFIDLGRYHHIYKTISQTVNTDDVVITGVKLIKTEQSEEGENTVSSYFYGQEGYVIVIEENPLAQDLLQALVNSIGSKLVGMYFRPLNCSALGDPAIEAGDAAYVSDRKGNSYPCYFTNISYTLGSYATFTCDAQTESEQQSVRYNVQTKIERKIAKEVTQRMNSMEQQFNQFNDTMTNAMGFYSTQEKQEDGSTITYLHNKPVLGESETIWKQSIDGFAVSLDGGKTWTAGITKEGNIIANVLSVVGINAEWINAGTIRALHIEGCTIKGSSIESISGNNQTKIVNGTILSNLVFLTDADEASEAQSCLSPSLFTLFSPDGKQSFVVKLENNSPVISSTAPLEIKNNIYAVGKDLQVGTINGQQIVTPYTLQNYVSYDTYNTSNVSIWNSIGQLWAAIGAKGGE